MPERIELRRSVVAGQRIRIAEEKRIAVRHLQSPIKTATDAAAAEELRVLHAVEGCRSETVTLEQSNRLPLHLRSLSDLHEERCPLRTLQRIGLLADANPQFVRIGFAIARRRIAPVLVD